MQWEWCHSLWRHELNSISIVWLDSSVLGLAYFNKVFILLIAIHNGGSYVQWLENEIRTVRHGRGEGMKKSKSELGGSVSSPVCSFFYLHTKCSVKYMIPSKCSVKVSSLISTAPFLFSPMLSCSTFFHRELYWWDYFLSFIDWHYSEAPDENLEVKAALTFSPSPSSNGRGLWFWQHVTLKQC